MKYHTLYSYALITCAVLAAVGIQAKLAQAYTLPENFCHNFTVNMEIGDSGDEVLALRQILATQHFLEDEQAEQRTYNSRVATAVSAFQEKYAASILVPNRLKKGTGVVANATRATLNQLYGCNVRIPTPEAPMPTTPSTAQKYVPSTISDVKISNPYILSRNSVGDPTVVSMTFNFTVHNNNDLPMYISKNPALALGTISNVDSAAAMVLSMDSLSPAQVSLPDVFYIAPTGSRTFQAIAFLATAGNNGAANNVYLNIARVLYSTTTPNIQNAYSETSIYVDNLRSGTIRMGH